ncbi:MAG TPA: K(+)-transporting ATPase subunit F [Amycolatopsis sp.]|nr:K(+)-transporting ATPase subunit F [Amycolatopsis sp.]
MTGTSLAANIVAGVLALGLIVYLFVALIRPEKF